MYEQSLVKVIEPIKKTTISRLNKSKKWKYGYNKEHDIIVISKTGQIGEILEIQNLRVALPRVPGQVFKHELDKWVKIDQPKDRNEFIVREHLFRLLDPPIEEKYLLSFSTNISYNTGIVTKENQTTRYIVNSTTNYSIRNIETGDIVYEGTVFGTSSYSSNINTTTYSSNVSEQNSMQRLSRFTAEKIIAEIEINGSDWLKKDAIKKQSN